MPVDWGPHWLSKTSRKHYRATAVYIVLRDHAPDVFTAAEGYEAWLRYGHPEMRDFTFKQFMRNVRALQHDELVVEYPKRKLFYVLRAVELERIRQRKIDTGVVQPYTYRK